MIRSNNELVALAAKAARGAGVPVDQAMDFGRALAALAPEIDLDDLKAALEPPFGRITAEAHEDRLDITKARIVLAAPAALDALFCESGSVRLIDVDAARLAIGYARLWGLACDEADGTVILRKADLPVKSPPSTARHVPEDIWDWLNSLAARTYVPASESSRLSGAGAGLTDND